MLSLKRIIPLACALALFASASIAPAGVAFPGKGPGALTAKKGKAKKGGKCRKGYVSKTITRHGKKVKVCRKKRPPRPTPAPAPSKGLFEAPGQKLEGEAAKPFLQKYLLNSTFTDCPPGWPNCAVEQRYSHTAGGLFYYCRLTSVSGADIINGGRAYQVQNVVVEADGSWTFNEQVENSGGSSFYEWHVATNGAVNGAYQFNGGGIEQIGPLQYVSGARDCSY